MTTRPLNIAFCASEAVPYVKTGGLADVAGALPVALSQLNANVSLILPAYRAVLEKLDATKHLSQFNIEAFNKTYQVYLHDASDEQSNIKVWLIDIPELFDRDYGIYLGGDGQDWWDNGERFSVFSKAVVEVAMNRVGLNWQADVVHSHDWQSGLVSALLTLEQHKPKTIFTIHNLAYQGNFNKDVFNELLLPEQWWHPDYVEFYDHLSMLKAGINFADIVTTVSPTYAKEICTRDFGCGLDGVLKKCDVQGRLFGILNGVDQNYWHPQKDRYIECQYDSGSELSKHKYANQQQLLKEIKADAAMVESQGPLFGLIGRLVEQKGIDLVLSVLEECLEQTNANFVFLGSGAYHYEQAIEQLSYQYPDRVACHIGYNEALAHQIEAGCDAFLMPSKFEPCGLNQMYSLLYGTLPVVHHTGGLADTVVNATYENIKEDKATGFVFYTPSAEALKNTIIYACEVYADKPTWRKIQVKAMQQDFSWHNSAKAYYQLYID